MLWIVSEWPPVRWLRSALFWAARPRLLRLRIADAAALARSRRELAELDDRLCQDLGITRLEAGRQAGLRIRASCHPGRRWNCGWLWRNRGGVMRRAPGFVPWAVPSRAGNPGCRQRIPRDQPE